MRRLDYHTRILCDHRGVTAAGLKTNTADKHILHPKPAGFGLLLPPKNRGGGGILPILHCEVNWLTQPCHYKVNTHTHIHTPANTLCARSAKMIRLTSFSVLRSEASSKTGFLTSLFCQIFFKSASKVPLVPACFTQFIWWNYKKPPTAL